MHSKTGEPILDPNKVDEGVLLPIGGHKGSGLALMIGLLAGVLNGAAFGRDVIDRRAGASRPTPGSSWWRSTCRASSRRRCSPPRWTATSTTCARRRRCRASTAIRMPGEDRRKRRADRAANGVRAAGRSWCKQLDELAASLEASSRCGRAAQPTSLASHSRRRRAATPLTEQETSGTRCLRLGLLSRPPSRAPAAAPPAAAPRPPRASCRAGCAGRRGC